MAAGIFSSFTGPMASTSAPIKRVRTGIIGELDSVRLGVEDSWDWWMPFDRIAGLTTAKTIVLLVGYTVGPGVGGVSRMLEPEESLERIRIVIPTDSKGRF